MFMKGENGKSLEKTFVKHFDELERIEENHKILDEEMGRLKDKLQLSYSKMQVLKYNAFKEMGGNLSFAFAMLDQNNTGFILNSVHSREGCYLYIKDIEKGETETLLGSEEKEALERALGY